VGKPNERERYYHSASGKYITAAKSHYQRREITYNTQTVPPKSALISMPSPYCCMTLPENAAPRKSCQQHAVRTVLYGPTTAKTLLENCAKTRLDFRAFFSLLYGLYKSIQYGLQEQKNNSATKQKFILGIRALAPLENVPSLLFSFLSQAYSKISQSPLVFSMCLAHYPMHFFINLKMTFSLQSVFSPSPTLNPKAKIRSCLFQDQGS
jgi:hypothetical protein